MREHMSYHNLFITTENIKRTSIFNLPYGYMVTCTRVTGWELWQTTDLNERLRKDIKTIENRSSQVLVAGEYHDYGLCLDIGTTDEVHCVIVDTISTNANIRESKREEQNEKK